MIATDFSAALWRTLLFAEQPQRTRQLVAATGCSIRTANQRLHFWCGAGLVSRTQEKAPAFALTGTGREHMTPPSFTRGGRTLAARPEPALARVWRAMRALSKRGSFDAPLVAMIAGTTPAYARESVSRLSRAGYLRLVEPGKNWLGKPAVYRLTRDTGPAAPRIDVRPGGRVLIDGNTGERIALSSRDARRSDAANALADGGVG